MICTDITAFLHAPRETGRTIDTEAGLFKLKIAEKDEVCVVDKALYGLTTSPRDWSVHRDAEIRKMRWECGGVQMRFVETEEPNLWRIAEVESETVRGLMDKNG